MELGPTDYSWEYQAAQGTRYERNTLFVRNRVKNILEIAPIVKGERVLDLGCSTGTMTIETSKLEAFSVGLDFSWQALQIAKDLFAKYGKGKERFVRADAELICFKNNVFDKIVCADFVEHVNKATTEKVLEESFNLLKNQGELILYTPCASHLIEICKRHNFVIKQAKTHIDVKYPDYLKSALEKIGFKINRLYYLPQHFPLIKEIETCLMKIPYIGKFFRRRICILAQKP